MKKGFVVSAILYPLLVIALTMILGVIAMNDNRRKILDNMKLEVSEESETDPEMSNSALYYKMKALEEAYAEMSSRLSEERFEELQDTIKKDYEDKINIAKTQTKLEAFPIGSIFISTNSTNPSSYIGGLWESYGQGRTLIGVGTGTDSNSKSQTFSSGSVGGEYTHTLTTNEMPSHSHNIPALTGTASSAGAHAHTINATLGATAPSYAAPLVYYSYALGPKTGRDTLRTGITTENGNHTHPITTVASISGAIGMGEKHNNIQPYIVVYFWKRVT